MLEVGVSELRVAFARHRSEHDKHPNPLLLFYAAECGLKVAWMRRNNVRTTRSFDQLLANQGHNLAFWAKELRLPRFLVQNSVSFRLKRDPAAGAFGVELSHQAWRYGAAIVDADETSLIEWLTKLTEWAKEELLQ
jgi:hypothetical protein